MEAQQVKQRFGIIGNSPALNRAIEVAMQVAPTDISVLITGESGTGKEVMPQIVHQLSARKHGPYIAVNCGAIPEGTIDSELFGHEKGSFTGAHDTRKGYFEVANGGTIFLDEVAELPLSTQVRLLRVLETGEFIRVGSSKPQKTDVRIVAATNVDMPRAIQKGDFREDLFYRLSTVPIKLPALRERKEDVSLIFRKFAIDFAEKYRMPAIKLDPDAGQILVNYNWPGNIRQLKNVAEQISVIESDRLVNPETLLRYLPHSNKSQLPMVVDDEKGPDFSEREILYKVLFDMKKDLTDMKRLVLQLMEGNIDAGQEANSVVQRFYNDISGEQEVKEEALQLPHPDPVETPQTVTYNATPDSFSSRHIDEHVEVEESLSLEETEIELIKKALQKHRGKGKYAAQDLGISERTLYRKIKEHNIT